MPPWIYTMVLKRFGLHKETIVHWIKLFIFKMEMMCP